MESQLLAALPDAVLALSEERVVWANEAAEKQLLRPRGELVGTQLEALLAPGELERLESAHRQLCEGIELPATSRVRFLRGDGVVIYADVRFGLTTGQAGPLLVLSVREVTESRRAEELMSRLADLSARASAIMGCDDQLGASEHIFRALGWTVALIEVDGENATFRRLIAPRRHANGVYGKELLGKPMPLARYPLVAQVARLGESMLLEQAPAELVGGAQPTQAPGEARTRVTHSIWAPVWKGNRVGHVLTVVGSCLTQPDFVAIQLFAAQLSAAIRLEELRGELVRNERLAAVGEMSAVLAHEVRNPLGVIFNAVGGMRRMMPDCSKDVRALLEIVAEEADRLTRLVHDLLDFARPHEPQLRPLSLAEVTAETLRAACQDQSFVESEPRLEVDVPANLPEVQGDALLLRRALLNVLVNAFQHVPPGGRVGIEGRLATEGWLRLRVVNDGPPVHPGVVDRIFEPFVTTRATGSGLGLAVVRRIIEDLHGRVQLDPGQPTSFSIWLPSAQEDRLSKR